MRNNSPKFDIALFRLRKVHKDGSTEDVSTRYDIVALDIQGEYPVITTRMGKKFELLKKPGADMAVRTVTRVSPLLVGIIGFVPEGARKIEDGQEELFG